MTHFDAYILLVLPAMLLAFWAQFKVNSTFKKYSSIRSASGLTGADCARAVLAQNGVHGVTIEKVAGNLSDHYDPRTNVIRLSESVYDSTSVAAAGVAAHEAGHAVQHNKGYFPIKIRNAILPVCQIGSNMAMPLFILGLISGIYPVAYFGVIAFIVAVLFQLVTLPVEFNASRRAIAALEGGIANPDEVKGARKVLSAAAMTYVASLAVALANILRLVILLRGGRRR